MGRSNIASQYCSPVAKPNQQPKPMARRAEPLNERVQGPATSISVVDDARRRITIGAALVTSCMVVVLVLW